jgi:RimJ/RimL family protein N-acetyltransferase
MSIARNPLATARLRLRPSVAADAERAFEIQSDWRVTRNLRMARFPADRDDIASWFVIHEAEWLAGTAFRFAIEEDSRMVGLVDVDEVAGSEGDLGYWLEPAAWGKGFAYEAASALVRFAFDTLGLSALNSGHAADNPNSGRILTKLGFARAGEGATHSRSRGETIRQIRYRLVR